MSLGTIARFYSKGIPSKVPDEKNVYFKSTYMRSASQQAGFRIGSFALPARENFESTLGADCLLNKNGL